MRGRRSLGALSTINDMDSSGRILRGCALTATAGGLGYAASKVHLAVTGQLGLAGFPAAASSYRAANDVMLAQLANAGVGLVAAALAFSLLWPMRRRRVRLAVHMATWIALLMLVAGWVGFTVRAFNLGDGLGPPVQSPAAQLTLFVGAVWIVSWALAERLHWRGSPEAQVPADGPSWSPSA